MRSTSKHFPLAFVTIAAVALLLVTTQKSGLAQAAGYTFTQLAAIAGPAPGGGTFSFDFEPSALNGRGDAAFVGDITPAGEGVFVNRGTQLSAIARTGQAAPGGGTFGAVELGRMGFNDQGSLAFGFLLDPFTLPLGVNGGLYRFSRVTNSVNALVVPNVTPAPGGGTFAGVGFNTGMNSIGTIVFGGIIPTVSGISGGLGSGVFRVSGNQIASVVVPGDAAPGGGIFDFAQDASINDSGDIAFGAHVHSEACNSFGAPQTQRIFCAESLYLRRGASGVVESIEHQGDAAPGGGTLQFTYDPVINNQRDIVFMGGLTPAPDQALAVFLRSSSGIVAIARPGDALPGGGHFLNGSTALTNAINNRGDVAFAAVLDTDTNNDSVPDSGVYVWSRGVKRLVARTGTVLQGIGTVAYINPPSVTDPIILSGVAINDGGQLLFQATLTNGTGVLLAAAPR